MLTYSNEIWTQAQLLMPGGVNSPVRAFRGVGGDPIFFKRGLGPYLFDLNDKKYIDYVCAWGPLIFGHAYPPVIKKVVEAIQFGLGFGAPHPLEVEFISVLTKLIPSLEKVRLLCTGTEATQTAIRLARGYTNRHKILKFEGCYHGHVDALLVKAGSGALTFGIPDSLGIPPEVAQHTLTLPYNDLAACESIFKQMGEEIAAIIVEPIAGNMNCVLPLPHFLPGLRKLADKYKTILIFDEIITGFRVGLNGAQSLYVVKPDLTCLGKIIGGGLPLAAVGGKKEIMEKLSPLGGVYQAGTQSGNPIALSAGLSTLKALIDTPEAYEKLNGLRNHFCSELKQLADQFSIPVFTQGLGGLFGIFFTEQASIQSYEDVNKCNREHYKKFFHGLLKRGVYFAPSPFELALLSLSHEFEVLDHTLEMCRQVFKTW